MISLQGEFYVCWACTTVMVHNRSTKDSHEDFCHKSSVFKREVEAFYNKHPLWQPFVMNVLLDKQEWCSKDGSAVATRLPRLRMPEMPIPSAWHMVRAIGVPSNVSSNCPGLRQFTLTQLARSPPTVAAATPKRKNRTSTLDAESDDYTDFLSKDPNYKDGKPAAWK